MARIAPSETAFQAGGRIKRPRIDVKAHRRWIASLPSVLSGIRGCQCAHVRYGSAKHGKRGTGMGEKPDDCWTVPLTPLEHRVQHGGGEQAFWKSQGIDPLDIALRLWAASGDDERGEAIILWARR